MIILGISCHYHDASACIIKDGKIVAGAAEERFSREKHDNDFPELAIRFCLKYSGITMKEVDLVAFYEKPIIKFSRIFHQHLQHFPKSQRIFVETMGSWFNTKLQIKKLLKKKLDYTGRVAYVDHHLSHSAASFYLSKFKQSVVVTLDGVGEWTTTTLGKGKDNEIKIDKEICFPHSLGLFYSTVTAYLGFKVNNDEYKVMGLAAYGEPGIFRSQMNEIIQMFPDGSYALNMKYFDYTWTDRMPSKAMEKLFGHPIREPNGRIRQYHKDIAAALQAKLEEVVFHLLRAAYKKYKIKNLCLGGGVSLNSVMNGKILKNTPFTKLYITPDPGDGGGALGAALYIVHQFDKHNVKKNKKFSPFLGPEYDYGEIKNILNKFQLKHQRYQKEKELLDKVTDLLIKKKVIGWFQGRMEWGPRALGARSILTIATEEKMRDILNAKVKHREMFRPFAPVILEEYVGDYFETDRKSSPLAKYMLIVYPFKDKGKKAVPAVVHVNGSGRLQAISRQDNPLYYDLIETYKKKTGIPIIINTSFNIRGEPIVCNPEDALKCFLGTGIDYLVMGNFLVTKKESKND